MCQSSHQLKLISLRIEDNNNKSKHARLLPPCHRVVWMVDERESPVQYVSRMCSSGEQTQILFPLSEEALIFVLTE